MDKKETKHQQQHQQQVIFVFYSKIKFLKKMNKK